jgi:DNA-binding LacI/PurR family transcriptional regulator
LYYRPKGSLAPYPERLNPNPDGRALHGIGIIFNSDSTLPPQANPFYSQVMAGIEAACRRSKITLLYTTLPVDQNNVPVEVPRLLLDSRVDGLPLVGPWSTTTIWPCWMAGLSRSCW